MYVLTIAYPKSADASFDFDYYRATHLPKIGEAFRPFGLGYAAVLRGEQSVDGGEPAFFVTTLLSFATEEGARNAVASEAGAGCRRRQFHQRDAADAMEHVSRVNAQSAAAHA